MILKNRIYIFFFLLTGMAMCVEPYDPPSIKGNTDFLVIDGMLNVSEGLATISIRHSIPLQAKDAIVPEEGAIVEILDDNNNALSVPYSDHGQYIATGLAFDMQQKYYISVKTTDGLLYKSDLIELKKTPPIDSVTWSTEDNALNIKVNTHDDKNESKYYKWDFTETYQYSSPFSPVLILDSGVVRLRNDDEIRYMCWKSAENNTINIASSKLLTQDIISDFKIRTVKAPSILLSREYSILVRQYSLTEDGYNYWLNVQKTTESLGGLFDPLPSAVIGNIHCITDPERTVIGFISGGEVTSKRIFVNADDIKGKIDSYDYRSGGCTMDTVRIESFDSLFQSPLVSSVYDGPRLIGYTYASERCIDCVLFGGGVLTKPEFWDH